MDPIIKMQCFHPRDVKVKQKITWNHYVDRYIRVPCGRCFACRRQRQQDWSFRIQQESKDCLSKGGSVYFITLTYDDDHLVYLVDDSTGEVFNSPSLDTHEIGSFCRKLRKRFGSDSVRYFGCGEYGDEGLRPHYHIVLFLRDKISSGDLRPIIENCWKKGLVLGIHPLTTKLSEYVAKYSMKRFGQNYDDRVAPFARMSLKPAIGSSFLSSKECASYKRIESFVVYDWTGTSYKLPRYFRDRMYSKDLIDARRVSMERQQMTLNEVIVRTDPLKFHRDYLCHVRYEENLIKSLNFSYVKSVNV